MLKCQEIKEKNDKLKVKIKDSELLLKAQSHLHLISRKEQIAQKLQMFQQARIQEKSFIQRNTQLLEKLEQAMKQLETKLELLRTTETEPIEPLLFEVKKAEENAIELKDTSLKIQKRINGLEQNISAHNAKIYSKQFRDTATVLLQHLQMVGHSPTSVSLQPLLQECIILADKAHSLKRRGKLILQEKENLVDIENKAQDLKAQLQILARGCEQLTNFLNCSGIELSESAYKLHLHYLQNSLYADLFGPPKWNLSNQYHRTLGVLYAGKPANYVKLDHVGQLTVQQLGIILRMRELKPIVVSQIQGKFIYMKKLKDLGFSQLYDLQTPCTSPFSPNFAKLEAKLATSNLRVAPLSRYLELRIITPEFRNIIFSAVYEKYVILSEVKDNQVYSVVKSLKGTKFRKIYLPSGKTIIYPGEVTPFYGGQKAIAETERYNNAFSQWNSVLEQCTHPMKRREIPNQQIIANYPHKVELERQLGYLEKQISRGEVEERAKQEEAKRLELQAGMIESVVKEIDSVVNQKKTSSQIGMELKAIRKGIENQQKSEVLTAQDVQKLIDQIQELKEQEKQIRGKWEENQSNLTDLKQRANLEAKLRQEEEVKKQKRMEYLSELLQKHKNKYEDTRQKMQKVKEIEVEVRYAKLKQQADKLKELEKGVQENFEQRHLKPITKEEGLKWKAQLNANSQFAVVLSKKQRKQLQEKRGLLKKKLTYLLIRCQQIWLDKQIVQQIIITREKHMLSEVNHTLDQFYDSSILTLPFKINIDATRKENGEFQTYQLLLKRDGELHNPDELSGGQTTLMSMSLLLAVFYFSPIPFLFLDQADAGLDVRNVHVLAQIVQKIIKSHKQVVAISHMKEFASYGELTLEVLLNPPVMSEKIQKVKIPKESKH